MNRIPFLLLLLFTSTACSQRADVVNDIPTITFDITQLSDWTVDSIECKFIPLETKDESLLSYLYDVQFYKDKIFVVDGNQKGQVMVFDMNGKFITQVGYRGDGPGGYIMPNKLHIDEDKNQITVVDIRLNRVIHYKLDDYSFVSSQNAFNHFDCTWLADGNMLWYSSTGFDTGKREHYHIYITNADLEILSSFVKVKESSPYMVAEHALFQYDCQTYISTVFSPVIYRVSSDEIEPVFKVSFGKQTLPSAEYISEIMSTGQSGTERLFRSDYVNSFSMFETPDYLGITYYANGYDSNLGFFNKQTKESHTFSMKEFAGRFGITGGRLMTGRYGDYFIMALNAKPLKAQPTFREDLNQITKNMTEEDNPILCLFKFNE